MRSQLPFAKPRIICKGDADACTGLIALGHNLLFKVRQVCATSGAPVFALTQRLPDGSIVQASSHSGIDTITVTPVESAEIEVTRVLKYNLFEFRAIPSSENHLGGFVPTDAPGPSAAWWNYLQTDPPTQLTDHDINSNHPGEVTWVTPSFMFGGYPLVLSWRGPQHRYGKFAYPSSVLSNFEEELTTTQFGPGFLFTTSQLAPTPPWSPAKFASNPARRAASVWLNGHRVSVQGLGFNNVESAALHVFEGEVFLRVYATRKFFQGKLIGEGAYAGFGAVFADPAAAVSVTQLSALPTSARMVQTPYFNPAGTKAVAIQARGFTGTPSVNTHNGCDAVVEIDPATAGISVLFEGGAQSNTSSTLTYSDSGTYEWTGAELGWRTDAITLDHVLTTSDSSITEYPIAADYEGVAPVYCTARFTTTLSTTDTQLGDYDRAVSPNHNFTRTVASLQTTLGEVVHSTRGVLLQDTETLSENYTHTNASNGRTGTNLTTKNGMCGQNKGAWLWGDIRVGNFVVATEPDLVFEETVNYTPSSSHTDRTRRPGARFIPFIDWQARPKVECFGPLDESGDGSGVTEGDVELTPTVSGSLPSSPTVGTRATLTGAATDSSSSAEVLVARAEPWFLGSISPDIVPVMLPTGTITYEVPFLTAPLYCAIATSPLGEKCYMGICFRATIAGALRTARHEAVYSSGVASPVPAYAEGLNPAMLSAVFLGLNPNRERALTIPAG